VEGSPCGIVADDAARRHRAQPFADVALVVVPVLLYFVPRVQWLTASLGLGYRDAFLVLPLVPALVLAALAVWATTRP
jgi:hypothetical protein